MTAHRGLIAACCAAMLTSVQAEPVVFALDPSRSFVHFEVMHFGTSTMRGRFGPISGEATLDRAAHRGEVRMRIATGTVDTGLAIFDARLRQADLLASDAWPTAYFVATQFGFDGEQLRSVRGEFTLRGISQPLTLRALHFACRPPAAGIEGEDAGALHEVCGGDFEGDFKRSDHGADFGVPFVADRVHLRVQVTGLR